MTGLSSAQISARSSDHPPSARAIAFFGADHPGLRYDPKPCPRGIPPEWFRAPWRDDDPVPSEFDLVSVAAMEYDVWGSSSLSSRLDRFHLVKSRLHKLDLFMGGRRIKYRAPSAALGKVASRGDRAPCLGFSARSRHACLSFLNSIDRRKLDVQRLWFCTLTYPGVWPPDPSAWKKHLDAWRRRVQRRFGFKLSAVWKLEPQRRGAPHFHLILLMPSDFARGLSVVGRHQKGKRIVTRWKGGRLQEFRQFVSTSWSQVVAGWDGKSPWVPTVHQARHEQAGTNVEPLQAWEQAISYCGKYIGKAADFIDEETGEMRSVGRYWGVWRREDWPIERSTTEIDEKGWYSIRRVVRKYLYRVQHRRFRGEDGRPPAYEWISHPQSLSSFVPAEMVHRLINWACPWLADGCSTRGMIETDLDVAHARVIEREAWLYGLSDEDWEGVSDAA